MQGSRVGSAGLAEGEGILLRDCCLLDCILNSFVISKVNSSAHVMTRLLKATVRSFCLCNIHEALDDEFREQKHKKVLII